MNTEENNKERKVKNSDADEALRRYVILMERERVEEAMDFPPMKGQERLTITLINGLSLKGIILNWKSLREGLQKHLGYVEKNIERLENALALKDDGKKNEY